MRKQIFSVLLVLAVFFSLGLAHAVERDHILTIVNHFARLNFQVDRYGEIVPDLPSTFPLEKGEKIETRVINDYLETIAYMSAANADPEIRIKAIFGTGVSVLDNMLFVHSYLGDNIAYKYWPKNQYSGTLVFCAPKDYPCHP